MGKSSEQYHEEQESFRKRLRDIYKKPEVQAAMIAVRDARNLLVKEYDQAALAHWKELGTRASTGWGSSPEGEFQRSEPPKQCSWHIANVLLEYFVDNPMDPPGKRK